MNNNSGCSEIPTNRNRLFGFKKERKAEWIARVRDAVGDEHESLEITVIAEDDS